MDKIPITFINLTPHAVTVIGTSGDKICFPACPADKVARVAAKNELIHNVGDIPIYTTTYGETTNLPPRKWGYYFIVSLLVRQANPDRKDLVSPGELVRDAAGVIIGCKGFTRN